MGIEPTSSARRLSENRRRSEGKPFRVIFFTDLRRILVIFNENQRKKGPKRLFRSRLSILGQPPWEAEVLPLNHTRLNPKN